MRANSTSFGQILYFECRCCSMDQSRWLISQPARNLFITKVAPIYNKMQNCKFRIFTENRICACLSMGLDMNLKKNSPAKKTKRRSFANCSCSLSSSSSFFLFFSLIGVQAWFLTKCPLSISPSLNYRPELSIHNEMDIFFSFCHVGPMVD